MTATFDDYEVLRKINWVFQPLTLLISLAFLRYFYKQHKEKYGSAGDSSSSSSSPAASSPSALAAKRISQLKVLFCVGAIMPVLVGLWTQHFRGDPPCNVLWRMSAAFYVACKILFYCILLQRSRIVSIATKEKGLLSLIERTLQLSTYAGGLAFAIVVGVFIEGHSLFGNSICICYCPLPLAIIMTLLDATLSCSFLFFFILKLRALEEGIKKMTQRTPAKRAFTSAPSVHVPSSAPSTPLQPQIALTVQEGENGGEDASAALRSNTLVPPSNVPSSGAAEMSSLSADGNAALMVKAPPSSSLASSSLPPPPADVSAYSLITRRNILITFLSMSSTFIAMFLFCLASIVDDPIFYLVGTTAAAGDILTLLFCVKSMTGGKGGAIKKNKVLPS